MCPICIATAAAMVAAGATTTGGLVALVLRVTRSGKRSDRNQEIERRLAR
jgi:hypothetical protein